MKCDLFKIYLFVIVASFLLPLPPAHGQEVKEYTIKKGDTLWDISGRELNDSFLWPNIWKENPEIRNPDLVYPGQTVRIPLYVGQKEREMAPSASSAEAAAAPAVSGAEPSQPAVSGREARGPAGVPLRPLVDPLVLMSSGYVSDSVPSAGSVTGSPSDRKVFGVDDMIYVKMAGEVKAGDRFYFLRADNPVYHPTSGKYLGRLVEFLGIGEITGFQNGETLCRITKMFNDVLTGDLLIPYYEMTPPLTAGHHRRPNIEATVVAEKGLQMLGGNLDIIYIDRGEKDGVEVGDMFRTLNLGNHRVPNGTIQIINTRDTTATAIVKEFTDPVTPGNAVVQLQ